MIRTVIFDIDNTLDRYDDAHKVAFAALLEYAEKNLHMTAEEFTKLHAETMGRLKEQMGDGLPERKRYPDWNRNRYDSSCTV